MTNYHLKKQKDLNYHSDFGILILTLTDFVKPRVKVMQMAIGF